MDIASGVFPYNGFVALPDAGGKVLLHLSIVNLVRGGDGAGEGVSLPVRKVNGKGLRLTVKFFSMVRKDRGKKRKRSSTVPSLLMSSVPW